MHFYLDSDMLTTWLTHYGSASLFFLLILGILAFPVPEETLMVLAGALIRAGKLNPTFTMLAAYAGSICGITASYFVGRLVGLYFLKKYGNWIGMTEERLQKAHDWFARFGKWSLVIGYFIPGVRHFTGLTAGTTNLEYRHFALFAYSGAIIWVSTFLSIGYFFGKYWASYLDEFEISLDWISLLIIFIGIVFIVYIIKKVKDSLKK